MNKNSYRLVPGVVNYWGDILGNIEEQRDLVQYISTHGGGGGTTEAVWGSITGNISDQSDLMNTLSSYALASDIPSLEGYATESWVTSQGYLTSVPSEYATQTWVVSQSYITSSALSGYATESWVESQGYLTSVSDTFATKQWVSDQSYITSTALEGYATESWVSSQQFMTLSTDPLLQHNPDRQVGPMSCNFITVPYSNINPNRHVQYISDGWYSGLYLYNGFGAMTDGYFYKFNESTFNFDFFAVPTMMPHKALPLWKTPNNKLALGNQYLVSFHQGSSSYIANITESYLGGQYNVYSGHKDNIIYVGNNCYMIDYNNGLAYQFSGNHYFNWVTYDTNCSFTSLPRYKTYVEGNCVYTSGGVMYRFVEDIANQTVNVEALETPLYPLINGSVPDSDRIHKIGNYYIYYIKPYVYKWVPGNPEWELLDFDLLDFSYHPCGVDYGEYMFGNAYVTDRSKPGYGKLLVWNFTSSIYGESIYSNQEDYYDKIDYLNRYVAENRLNINTQEDAISGLIQSVSQINDEIGTAINTTNNILS